MKFLNSVSLCVFTLSLSLCAADHGFFPNEGDPAMCSYEGSPRWKASCIAVGDDIYPSRNDPRARPSRGSGWVARYACEDVAGDTGSDSDLARSLKACLINLPVGIEKSWKPFFIEGPAGQSSCIGFASCNYKATKAPIEKLAASAMCYVHTACKNGVDIDAAEFYATLCRIYAESFTPITERARQELPAYVQALSQNAGIEISLLWFVQLHDKVQNRLLTKLQHLHMPIEGVPTLFPSERVAQVVDSLFRRNLVVPAYQPLAEKPDILAHAEKTGVALFAALNTFDPEVRRRVLLKQRGLDVDDPTKVQEQPDVFIEYQQVPAFTFHKRAEIEWKLDQESGMWYYTDRSDEC